MRGIANAILLSMIIGVFMTTFSNFIMFFPWYFTLIYETFHVSLRASNINVVNSDIVREAKLDLSNRPIFKKLSKSDIKIFMDDVEISEFQEENNMMACLQRGQMFDVTVQAKFPFHIKFGDLRFERTATITFTIPTTGIKYYKDLEAYP